MDTARALLETNTLGTLCTIQAVLPHFRERRAGVIVNVSSSVTLKPLPIVGLYRASKMAVNAMSESLAVELAPLGVRVHVVLPGRAPSTQFGENARAHMHGFDHPDYAPMIQSFTQSVLQDTGPVTEATDVAESVWKAATEPNSPLRMAAGADAEQWLAEFAV